MQKKLIALAIAGLASSAAFAQSNVTVYGVADVYYGTGGSTGTATRTAVNSGGLAGSRIGFKGVEDLGNGLKALFTLEYGLNMDDTSGVGTTAAGAGNARQQFVGLTGGFGTAVAGRLQTAGYDFSGATNALHGTAINPLQSVTANTNASTYGLIHSSSRANNAVAYISPSFGGVTIAVNHARLTEAANATTGSDAFANLLSATYVNGPLTVAAITTSAVVTPNLTGTTTYNVKENGLGGSYDFGVATLKASYLTRKVADNDSNKAWQISGIVPVSAVGKVVLGYAKNTIKTATTGINFAPGALNTDSLDSKAYTIAYLHSLSKRTTLYTGYAHLSNEKNATLATALGGTVAASTNGTASRTFVAGINHSF